MLSFNISSWRGPEEVHVMFGNTCLVGPKLSGLFSLLCTHENMLFSRDIFMHYDLVDDDAL